MNHRYRITPEGRPPDPSDHEIARYRDPGRLLYNYQRAKGMLHRRPLYKDPKAFLALLLILLLAWLLGEVSHRDQQDDPASGAVEQSAP